MVFSAECGLSFLGFPRAEVKFQLIAITSPDSSFLSKLESSSQSGVYLKTTKEGRYTILAGNPSICQTLDKCAAV